MEGSKGVLNLEDVILNQIQDLDLPIEFTHSDGGGAAAPPQIQVDEKFPVIYVHPDEDKVFWICDFDQDGKLTSVIMGHGERYVAYLETPEKYYECRKGMEEAGWLRTKLPNIKIKFKKDGKSRKEKRKDEREKKKSDKKQKILSEITQKRKERKGEK